MRAAGVATGDVVVPAVVAEAAERVIASLPPEEEAEGSGWVLTFENPK